jgi:hypothetical protein
MTNLHITQDEDGFWMLSLEHPEEGLKLLAYHFVTPQHLISDAEELAAEDGDYPGARVLVDPPRAAERADVAAVRKAGGEYRRPEAKRAANHAL